jgi:hypothetical protein
MRFWQIIGLVLLVWVTLILGTTLLTFITTGKA